MVFKQCEVLGVFKSSLWRKVFLLPLCELRGETLCGGRSAKRQLRRAGRAEARGSSPLLEAPTPLILERMGRSGSGRLSCAEPSCPQHSWPRGQGGGRCALAGAGCS